MNSALAATPATRPANVGDLSDLTRGIVLDPRIPATVPGFDAPFFQAGLAGYSDGAMRVVAREHGCPYCVTEALLDRTLLAGGVGKRREDPDLLERGALARGETGGRDHPIAGQVIGSEPDEMARAAIALAELGYETIDVNLACPVKKIKNKGRGGHLLADPERGVAILAAVRRALPASIPTSAKLRRGFDDGPDSPRRFERVFQAAYDLGYAWTTVHARTVAQKYVGPSDWSFLARLVERHPDRLVFGSGDVWDAADIFRMLRATGVAAVSVARGCIGNPWIFRQARAMLAGQVPRAPTIDEQRRVLLRHLELSVALHGEPVAARMMRKFGIMFSRHHPRAMPVKEAFIACAGLDDWRRVCDREYTATPAESSETAPVLAL